MKLKIVNKSGNALPEYKTPDSSGMDLRAYLPEGSIVLNPMERKVIPTGLYMEIEPGHEGQVRPRSGCAVKQGLTVINAPGTIDAKLLMAA
jgi:dUTP pyrophosphatase